MTRFSTCLTAIATVMALALPVQAHNDISGSYLAARQASTASDFREAVNYYTQTLVRDPSNYQIMESLIVNQVALGRVDNAVTVATRLTAAEDVESQIAELVMTAGRLKDGSYDPEQTVSSSLGLVDGLVGGWDYLAKGSVGKAMAAFDKVATQSGLREFGLFHKSLALALVGDYESAAEILSGDASGPLQMTRTGVIAYAQVLSQLERGADAVELLDATFPGSSDPELAELRRMLSAGAPVAFDVVGSAREGQAQVFYMLASALSGEADDTLALIYSRVAEYLDPGNIDAILLSAGLLESLGQYELATEAYDRVPREDPAFFSAEMGRAEALFASDKPDAAIEVLTQLGKTHGDIMRVHIALGDTLRRLERYEEAAKAYDRAIAMIDENMPRHWGVYYSRGIANERIDNWDQAEADFRFALALRPNQPLVLNYLGYSFVEKRENLEEALEMIETAVSERPNDGYITDSLGWVLYRLGRFADAVEPMERAVELMPVDPIINDHLGDVYWAVGRYREAEFQWRRALSFDPEEEELIRIRRKLEVGLDAVLEEEGADPISIANDG